jgi:manganese transport protein
MNPIQTEVIREPPGSLLPSIRFLGPGLLLSASIVGGGELIVTTKFGAQAGFTLLWVIILSCLVKVAIQLEYGRHCITHGTASFQSWNAGRGLRLAGIHWSVYCGIIYFIISIIGLSGVLGAAAEVASYAIFGIAINTWLWIIALFLGLVLFHGQYKSIEITATILNFLFVSAVLYCLFAVQGTPYAFSFSDVVSGLSFKLPSDTVVIAVAVFGITGLAAGEIFIYPSWCLEKGYAAWTGPRDESPEWAARARGWTRVMTLDAFVSMIVYTVSTIAFYLLGAAVLSGQDEIQGGSRLVQQLSAIFTEVMGDGTMAIFMLGAFAVLFSTMFANSAAFARIWTDGLEVCRLIRADDPRQRRLMIAIFSFIVPGGCALSFLLIQKPLLLMIFLGVVNSGFLLVVTWQALVYRYRETDLRLRPSRLYDITLWLSCVAILCVAIRVLWIQVVQKIVN